MIKRLVLILILTVQLCSEQSHAERSFLTIPQPTKVILSKMDKGFSIEIPNLKLVCKHLFLAEGNRGIIDCPGRYRPYSKTVQVNQNPYIKQLRFGTHPDKIRIVLDLLAPITLVKPSNERPNMFVFSFGGTDLKISAKSNSTELNKSKFESAPVISKKVIAEPEEKDVQKIVPESQKRQLEETQEKAVLESKKNSLEQHFEELPLSVEALRVTFNEGERLIHDLVLTNNSSSQHSVTIDSYPEPAVFKDEESSSEISKDSLTPSPRKFTLGPKQKRAVRFMLSLNNPSVDTNREIQFVARFSNNDGDQVAPKVMFIYVPKEALPELVATPQSGRIKLTNYGSAGVELSSGRCCSGGECEAVNLSRLAAGKSILLDLPENCQLEFVRQFRGSFQKFKVRSEILNDASR